MRTERWIRNLRSLLGMTGVIACTGFPAPTSAQDPLFLINADTRVSSITLEFPDTETLDRKAIRQRIGLAAPGFFTKVREVFDFLPLVTTPAANPFSPIELGRDAVRIGRFYQESGFLDTEVGYDVRLDSAANAVDVTFRIHEGRPIELDTIDLHVANGDAALDSELVPAWQRFTAALHRETGMRVSDVARVRIRSEPLHWLRSRGYPFTTVHDTLYVDSTNATARLVLRIDPETRSRVDSIAVEGRQSLGYRTVRREIPISIGDWFSASDLAEGQRQVFGLSLVRLALFDVAPDQPEDSTVTLQMRVEEGQPRLISGELGYATGRGVVAQGQWEHRNFMGGARTLTLSGVANTGFLAASGNIERRFGISPTLRQPWILDYRLSGSIRPFIEYRDDVRDESVSIGNDLSLLFERGSLKQISATYTWSARRIIDAPTLTASVSQADTIVLSEIPVDLGDVSTSKLGTSLVFGNVDNPLDPRRGFVTRASAEIAGPKAFSSVQYGRLEATITGFIPLGEQLGLVGRVSAGRLFPYGESVPDSLAEVLPTLLRLRDAVFTAGGTGDVRGWGNGMLGPKVPDLRIIEQGDSIVASANRYLVLTGLARFTASLELRMPLPIFGSNNGSHLFLDAGRVWAPDDRFRDPSAPRDPLGQEKLFFGTGVGVEFGTLVGPLRIDLGYKLNPSPIDMRQPDPVAKALVAGRPLSSVPTVPLNRWHLHIAIGRIY